MPVYLKSMIPHISLLLPTLIKEKISQSTEFLFLFCNYFSKKYLYLYCTYYFILQIKYQNPQVKCQVGIVAV